MNNYYKIRSYLGVIKNDLRDDISLPLFKRLSCWRQGFLAEKYYLYDYEETNFEGYLSDQEHSLTRFINGDYNFVLNNKVIFEELFSDLINIPQTLALILDGEMVGRKGKLAFEDFIQLVEEEKTLVIKPISDSAGGAGVKIVKYQDNNIYINNKKYDEREIKSLIQRLDHYFISEFVKQSAFGQELYAESVNTMRIVVGRDPKTKEGFIVAAAQRVGGIHTDGLDNFTHGGYSAKIDIDTGILGPLVSSLNNRQDTKTKKNTYDYHPDSQTKITGQVVPQWEEIKEKLLNIMAHKPYINYMGADILLTDEDKVTCIEINNHPDPDVVQVHEGLLSREKSKQFYQSHGIIK